jgi:hypothetical protein
MPSSPPRLASGCHELAFPKGPTRAEIKSREDREEQQIIKRNRAKCVRRDGDCRIGYWGDSAVELFGECFGASQWHHLDPRSLTRNEPPEVRHSTTITMMACGSHHRMLDLHEIKYEPQTEDGADGPLTFWVDESRRLVEHAIPKPQWR